MRGHVRLIASFVALVFLGASCSQTSGRSESVGTPTGTRPGLEDSLAVTGIEEHLERFSEIAARSGGTRAAGTPGYARSARYVRDRLEAAGYKVTLQRFEFPFFRVSGKGSVTLADQEGFREGADFKAMIYSSSGSMEAVIHPLRFAEDADERDGRGCSASAYEGFPSGAVVLLRPGPCFFRDQVEVAQAAGASAVIFAMPDYTRGSVLRPTLLSPETIDVPVLAASNEMGLALFEAAGSEVAIRLKVVNEPRTTMNVIADSRSGNGDGVVMAGGHLDSVIDGPGINDNGSGVATLIEVAEELEVRDLRRRVRFAFWSAEELGLLGSTRYVETLTQEERDAIDAYLNFDMTGSENFVRYIYEDQGAPEGSDRIHDLFEAYFVDENLAVTDIDLQGRSDHGPFIEAGIPVGGLFTGADMIKTELEEDRFGGTAGVFQDRCYHQACDDLDNVDRRLLGEMAAAVAYVVETLAVEGLDRP